MENVKFLDCKGNEISLSRIVFGGSNTYFLKGKMDNKVLSTFLEKGIFAFDTARLYGNGRSEELLASWMRNEGIKREKVTIITKCCHPTLGIFKRIDKKAAFKDIEKSLKALNVSYVDSLLLHRDDESKDAREIIVFMNEIIKKGYTRSIGVSNWKAERIKIANQYAQEHNLTPFSLSEIQYSIGERIKDPWHNGSLSITGEKYKKEKDFYISSNMPVLFYSSLADGFFSGKYNSNTNFKNKLSFSCKSAYYTNKNLDTLKRVEEIADKKNCSVAEISLAYCFHSKMNGCCITSVSNIKRLESNLKSLEINLSEEEMRYLSLE